MPVLLPDVRCESRHSSARMHTSPQLCVADSGNHHHQEQSRISPSIEGKSLDQADQAKTSPKTVQQKFSDCLGGHSWHSMQRFWQSVPVEKGGNTYDEKSNRPEAGRAVCCRRWHSILELLSRLSQTQISCYTFCRFSSEFMISALCSGEWKLSPTTNIRATFHDIPEAGTNSDHCLDRWN